MKKIFFMILSMTFTWMNAQEKIAIVEFVGSGVDPVTAGNITNRFSYELSKTNRFDIVEREMMTKILEEQKFQTSGCVTEECAVEIGQMIGVSQIVAGSVSKIESFYSLNVRLIDVETGKILYQDMDDFDGSVKDFIQITIKNVALRMAAEASIESDQTGTTTTQYASTKKGEAVFNLTESNVAIFVDGRYSSRSSGQQIRLSLAEGAHHIRFTLDGFNDWEKDVNIMVDEQIPYNVEMVSGISGRKEEVTTGILLVRSEPSNANVYVDGVEKGTTLLQMADIGVGEHEIRIEKSLYYSYSEIVTIQPDLVETVTAALKPNFGKLEITSVPGEAVVKINTQTKGRTPVTLEQLVSGTYTIELSKDLYHDHVEKFVITDGSVNQRDIQLTPAFGKLSVKSEPIGADVFLDGQSKGTTPFELDKLPSGKYQMKVSYSLYETIEKEIVIEDGKTNLQNYTLGARSGTLSIKGKPKGASISVNDKIIGKIPTVEYRLVEGMAEIKIEADNYHAKTEYINIERNQLYSKNIELERHTGKLVIISEPPDAFVILDNKEMGKTPKILSDIPTGKHEIEINHPDFLNQTKKFSLALNEKKEFNIKLMTYTGSIQQQIDNAVFKQRLSLGAVAATALLGLAMQAFAESNYDAYLNASSSSDATSLYDKTALQDMIAAGSYVAAGAMIIPWAKFTIDIGKLKKQLTGK